MTTAAILSQIGNTDAAYRSSLGAQPGYSNPDFWRSRAQASASPDLAPRLTALRDAARARKEYTTADALRDVLAALGHTVKDRR